MSSAAIISPRSQPDFAVKLAKFRKRLEKINADAVEKSSFEHFAAFLQHRDTLQAAVELVKASKVSSSRTLLAAFMIVHFPEEVLGYSMDNADEAASEDVTCFEAANSLVRVLNNSDSDIHAVVSAIGSFDSAFSTWRNFDQERMLKELAMAHHQWLMALQYLESQQSESRDPETVEEMADQVRKSIEANKRRIMQIGGKEAVERVERTTPLRIDLDQIINEVGAERYWEEFARELRAQPPRFERVIQLLSEIRTRLKALIPNKHAEMRVAIDAGIDIDFIRQLIHFNTFDGQTFAKLFDTIWNQIKNLQAAANDESWTKFRDEVIRDSQPESGKTWDQLLPKVFNRFLVQLDRIEDAAEAFRAQLEAMRQQQQSSAKETEPSNEDAGSS